MSDLADRISFAHQLGQLEGRINALERKVDAFEQRIENRLGSIEHKIDDLATLLHFGRGGWKTLALLGACLAAVLSTMRWIIDYVHK